MGLARQEKRRSKDAEAIEGNTNENDAPLPAWVWCCLNPRQPPHFLRTSHRATLSNPRSLAQHRNIGLSAFFGDTRYPSTRCHACHGYQSLVTAREAYRTDYTPASRSGLLRPAQRDQHSEQQAQPLPAYNIAATTAHSYECSLLVPADL